MTPVDRALAPLKGLSPRGRAGLAALGGLLALWGVMVLSESVDARKSSVERLQAQLSARKAALTQQDWSIVADEAQRARRAAETQFWRATTAGIAAARIQGAMEQAARAANVRNPRIEVRELSTENGLLLFEAQITGEDRGGQFATYVEAVAGSEGEVRLTLLEFTGQTRRFTARFLAPALIEEGTEE